MARILVVDDDPDFVKVTTKVLEKAGHEVVSAANGAKALKAMREETPDLVLLDIMMSYILDGLDVSREMAEDPDACVTLALGERDHLIDPFLGLAVPSDVLQQMSNLSPGPQRRYKRIRCSRRKRHFIFEFMALPKIVGLHQNGCLAAHGIAAQDFDLRAQVEVRHPAGIAIRYLWPGDGQ